MRQAETITVLFSGPIFWACLGLCGGSAQVVQAAQAVQGAQAVQASQAVQAAHAAHAGNRPRAVTQGQAFDIEAALATSLPDIRAQMEQGYISRPTPIKGGRQLLYLKRHTDWARDVFRRQLWLYDHNSKTHRALTPLSLNIDGYRVSQDERLVALVVLLDTGFSDRDLWVARLDGSDRRLLTKNVASSQIEWRSISPGRQQIKPQVAAGLSIASPRPNGIFFLRDEFVRLPLSAQSPTPQANQGEREDGRTYSGQADNGHTGREAKARDLVVRRLWYAPMPGRPHPVSKPEGVIISYSVSDEGHRIALLRAPSGKPDDRQKAEIFCLLPNSLRETRLTKNTVAERRPRISPNGKWIAFSARADKSGRYYYENNLFVARCRAVDIPLHRARHLLPHQAGDVSDYSWDSASKALTVRVNQGLSDKLYRVARRGSKATPAMNQEALRQMATSSVGAWGSDRNGRFQALALKGPNAGVYQLSRKRLEKLFDTPNNMQDTVQEKVTWKASDGLPIEGILSRPKGLLGPLPLVVRLHGGPADSDQWGDASLLAHIAPLTRRGFAVFQPNYRGSTGYGDAFFRANIGRFWAGAADDVETGLLHLAAQKSIDPANIFLTGWSAGGHLVNRLVTRPHPTLTYKAAISGASAGDWLALYRSSDLRYPRRALLGFDPDRLDSLPSKQVASMKRAASLLPLSDTVSSPILLIAGRDDRRVPAQLSQSFHDALIDAGVPAQIFIHGSARHAWLTPRARLDRTQLEINWLLYHLAYHRVRHPSSKPPTHVRKEKSAPGR